MATKETYRVGEFYLTKDRDGIWCRTWYCTERQQRRTNRLRTTDFHEAKEILNAWFVANSTPLLDDNLPLSRCLLEYWNNHASHLKRADTEQLNAKYWLEFFKDKLVNDIRPSEQRKFLEHLRTKKGFAKGTIESVFKTGAAAITWAWKNEIIMTPPPLISASQHLAKFKMPKKRRWRAMEVDEVAAMFDHSDNDKLTRFMILLLGCAGRPSATIEISGNSIDLNAGTIDLLLEGEAQTNKYRATVKLPSFVECLFHKDNLVSQSHFIPNLNNMRNRFWNPARDRAGLDSLVVPYSFRHTVAKWLRAEGVDAWHTSAQMGHKRKGSEITEIYAPSDPAYLVDALRATEELFAQIYDQSKALKAFPGLQTYDSRCKLVARNSGGKPESAVSH